MGTSTTKDPTRPVLVTGARGTVGEAVLACLSARDVTAVTWDRERASPDDEGAVARMFEEHAPSGVIHLALGAEAWAARIAASCRDASVPFVFTSTAMVFDASSGGPHRPDDARTARDGYGQYKIRCEDMIRAANEGAIIARLGWQIGERPGGNQMLEALDRTMEREGVIRASERWTPATSFLDDTAEALCALLASGEGGTYHLDANAECAWTYPRIVRALAERHARAWTIEPTHDYVHDQRLIDARIRLPSIEVRFARP